MKNRIVPMLPSFETHSTRVEHKYRIHVQVPAADIERILQAVIAIDPLVIGSYDSNAMISAAGTEHYRPRTGAAAGAEDMPRQRPGVCAITFMINPDQQRLAAIVEAVFQVHSYQEPVILVSEILASRSKGLDDSKNPNRWWNTTGDWKKHA